MKARALGYEFNSRGIAAFAVGFVTLFSLFCIGLSVEMRSLQRMVLLKSDVETVFNRIEGGPLKIAQLHSAEIAEEFLKFQFEEMNNQDAGRFLSAEILGGKSGVERYGKWTSSFIANSRCARTFSKTVKPDGAFYPFSINVTVNNCLESKTSASIGNAVLWIPLVLCGILIACLGSVLFRMLSAVKLADEIIVQNDDPQFALMRTEKIRWKNVRELLRRAIETKGKNLQFFHSLIKNMEHDVSGILETIVSRTQDKSTLKQIGAIQSILLRCDIELTQPILPFDDNADFEMPLQKFAHHVVAMCPNVSIEIPGFDNLARETIEVSDKVALDRILINLAVNAERHGLGEAKATVRVQNDCLAVIFENRISKLQQLRIQLAKTSGRIDTSNPILPVLASYFGREGLGLSIAKQSTLKLGGHFVFEARSGSLFCGSIFPLAKSACEVKPDQVADVPSRFLYLESATLVSIAKELGLAAFLVGREQIDMISTSRADFELASDVEINVPRGARFKMIERRERLVGIAKLWGCL